MAVVEIVRPGRVLVADLVAAAAPAPQARPIAFVVTHGWGSSRPSDIPAALAGAGFTSLAPDLGGHGASDGERTALSRADWVGDVVAAYDALRGHVGPGTAVGLVGASFGAYLSVLATRERECACLSLRVPANYPDERYDVPTGAQPDAGTVARWREWASGPGDSAAVAALAAFPGPVQIIDAERDDVIPPQVVHAYAAAVPPDRLTRATLPDAPHHLATPELRRRYIDLLLGWVMAVANG